MKSAKKLLLEAVTADNQMLFIQSIALATKCTPKQVKDSIAVIKELVTSAAKANNTSVEEIIKDPCKYGIFGANNNNDTE